MDDKFIKEFGINKQKYSLSIPKFLFLWRWLQCRIDNDREFGFIGVSGYNNQMKEAIIFLLNTEREWQDRTIKNEINNSFLNFFYKEAIKEGIVLDKDFIKKMEEKEF